MAGIIKTNELPSIQDLTNAQVIGLDAAGKDAKFPLDKLVKNNLGNYKTTDSAPQGALLNQKYDLIGTGSAGSSPSGTYTNLLGIGGAPIVVPSPATGNGIFEAKAVWNGTYWIPTWQEKALPSTDVMASLLANGIIAPGKNLINTADADVQLGRLLSAGTTAGNSSYNTTGYIPVVAGTTYIFTKIRQISFFTAKASANYIASSNTSYPSGTTAQVVTAPTGALFCRISVVLADWATLQMEVGTVVTAYEPYNPTIVRMANLPTTVKDVAENFTTKVNTLLSLYDFYVALTKGNVVVNGDFANGYLDYSIGTAGNNVFLATVAKATLDTPIKTGGTALRVDCVKRSSDNFTSIAKISKYVDIPASNIGGVASFSFYFKGDENNITRTYNIELYGDSSYYLLVSAGTVTTENIVVGSETWVKTNITNIPLNAAANRIRFSPRISCKTTATPDAVYNAFVTGLSISFSAEKAMFDSSALYKMSKDPLFASLDTTAIINLVFGNLFGKKWTSLGDSITALDDYQTTVISKFGLQHYLRGIGGSRVTDSTQIAWVQLDGMLIARPDNGGTQPSGTSGVDYLTINTAMSGDERINTIPLDSELITILATTNDVSAPLGVITDTTTSTVYGAYQTMLNKIHARCPSAEIIIMIPIWRNDELTSYPNFYLVREALFKIGKKYAYPVIDIGGECGINKNTAATYLSDGIHPNVSGCRRMSRVIIRGLLQIFASS